MDTLTSKAWVSTNAAGEMLIRRRLQTFLELVKEPTLSVDVTLVSSNQNKMYVITRVPWRWLEMKNEAKAAVEWSSATLRKYTCTADILMLDEQPTLLGRLPQLDPVWNVSQLIQYQSDARDSRCMAKSEDGHHSL